MASIKKLLLFVILLGSLLNPLAIDASVLPTVLYVKHDATGADDGSSWDDAYPNLQDALAAAVSGDEIWVAGGIYYPDEGSGQIDNERSSTFQLASGVAIYGGFAGTETERTERDWEANITVLSGDIEQDDRNKDENGIISSIYHIVGDNAYHVVTGSGTDSTAILDGVTINAGQANGSNPDSGGGGIYNNVGSPTLSNVSITSNYASYWGGGIYNNSSMSTLTNVSITSNYATDGGGMYNNSSHSTLTNVSITSNYAFDVGGGVYNNSSHPTLTNVSITGNSASSNSGGGMYNISSIPILINVSITSNYANVGGGMYNNLSDPTLINVSITSNYAYYDGGGMYNNLSDPTLTNVSITSNSASNNGGGISNNLSDLTLTNVIIWNNQASDNTASSSASIYNDSDSTPNISYSLIANSGGSDSWDSSLGDDGGNNIDDDPKFVMDGDPSTLTDGDYRLQIDSPAIDAGDNDTIGETSTDLDGRPRLWDIPSVTDSGNGTAPIVDMGAYEARLLHVDDDSVAASADGSSWENAYTSLQDALAAAVSGNEIWVAGGIYYPDEGSGQTDDERESTFQLASGVAIYGGFAGMETERTERDWEANITVLSGDIDQNDNNQDSDGIISSTSDIQGSNAYHVVTGSGTDSTAILDGLTINAGQANGGATRNKRGGGMYNNGGSPELTNLNITSNSATDGGGMHNRNSSEPTLINVNITSNSASYLGGGMYNDESSESTLSNVSITSNSATDGGGMYNFLSEPTLTNVSITSNSATDGGGMYNVSSYPTLTNVSITSNSATDDGGGMYNFLVNYPTLTNVIIWNNEANGNTASTSASIYNDSSNASISYSLIANSGGSDSWDSSLGTDGGNNISDDPKFVMDGNPSTLTDGDYRLQIDSPAIDAGDNDAIGSITTDLAGNPRIVNGTVDMGAYESVVCYVQEGASGNEDGSSFEDAWPTLQDALANSYCVEIWVAAGIYYPDEGSGQTDNERESTFQLASGVAIYGGFAGTETERTERDWEANITVLSGDLEQNDNNKDENGIISSTSDIEGSNAYHVVTGSGTDSSAIVDGVTINAGQANAEVSPDNRGGGMYNDGGSPTLSNLNLISNSATNGGGMHNRNSSHPTLSNVSITSNSATSNGGGMHNRNSSQPTLSNVSITSNSANNGGGMHNRNLSQPRLSNVSITSNFATVDGGGIFNHSSQLTLTNVIIWNNQANGNTASTSASIYNDDSNPTISYSLIANSGGSDSWDSSFGTDDGNNIDTSPMFVMDGDPSTSPPTDGDYRLQIDSPAIDAGNNDAIGSVTTDLAGNSRLADVTSQVDTGNGSAPVVDMGAYEAAAPDVQCNLSQGESYDFNKDSSISIQIETLGEIECIAVYRYDKSYPDAPEEVQTGRYWQVDVVDSAGSEASGFSLAVTLPHTLTTPSNARVCRYTGSDWDCDNSNTTADASTVTRSSMSAFSPIAVGEVAIPLAVDLASFSAEGNLDEIRLEWVTVSERATLAWRNNLGFNLYRAESADGSFGQTQLNNELIPSQVPGSGQGSAYQFVDQSVSAGTTYYYWLEDVDLEGNRQQHGPISATANVTTAVSLQSFESHHDSSAILVLLITILDMIGVAWRCFWRW